MDMGQFEGTDRGGEVTRHEACSMRRDRFLPVWAVQGCVKDAERMASLLCKHDGGSPNFDCRLIRATLDGKGDKIGRAELRRAIKELFAQPAEVALLHFSGHGTANDLDGYLVTQDAAAYDEGLAMSEILKMANDSRTEEVVVLLDCCHSGILGSPPVVNNARAMLREGISILTASRGDQVSVEENGAGVFSSLVADALEGGAADVLGDVTAPAIYAIVEGAFSAGTSVRFLSRMYQEPCLFEDVSQQSIFP